MAEFKRSYGLVVWRVVEQSTYFLLVRRRWSLGYIAVIRGHYDIGDFKYIQTLVDDMTLSEKKTLSKDLWRALYKQVFRKSPHMYKYAQARNKFNAQNWATLVESSQTAHEITQYGFPKGKRFGAETTLQAAIRETREETGIGPEHYALTGKSHVEMLRGLDYCRDKMEYKYTYYSARLTAVLPCNRAALDVGENAEIGWFSMTDLRLLLEHVPARLAIALEIDGLQKKE